MTRTRCLAAFLMVILGGAAQLACESEDGGGNPDGGGGGGSGGGGSAVQLLTFTGPISGSMTEATTDCGKTTGPPAQLSVSLTGKVAGVDRRVKIVINNYLGAASYGGNAVQVEIDGTSVAGDEASVAAGEASGTVESAMNRDGNKVSGAWKCASAPVSR